MMTLFGVFVKNNVKSILQERKEGLCKVVKKAKKCSNWGSNPRPSRY